MQSLLLRIRRLLDPRIGLLFPLEFLLVTLLACIIRRYWRAERAAARSQSLCNLFTIFFFFSFSKLRTVSSGGVGRRLGSQLAMSTAGFIRSSYTRPPKHMIGKDT